jgi:hypothetical protein
MAARSLDAPHIAYKPALPVRRIARNACDRLRRLRTERRPMTECFGSLGDRDEMVVKGLVASAASSARGIVYDPR